MNLTQAPQFSRDMKPGEEDAVEALLRAAFAGQDEATLVCKLRKSGVIAGETVMPMGDRIVAYYALSYMIRPTGWLVLAPVAVHPDVQRHGYGKRMIGMLTEWARLTQTPVVVVGEPGFYEKAGFSRECAANLVSPYPIAQTLLAGVGTQAPAKDLIYPQPFADR